MVGIPRPSNFFQASAAVDSTSILDDSVGAVDVANTLIYDLATKATAVGADSVAIVDSEASNINKKATLTVVGELMAGTVATSSLENASGVLKVDIKNTTATTEAAAADFVLTSIAATGVNKASTITNLAKPLGAIFAGANATSALSEIDGVGQVNIGLVTAKAAPVGADMLLIEDTVGADDGLNKMCTITQLAETLAGTVASTAIENASGVLSVAPADNTIAIGADSVVYVTAAGLPKKDLASDVVSAIVGTNTSSALSQASGVARVNVGGTTAKAVPVATDSCLINDIDDGSNKKVVLSNLPLAIADTMAGVQASTALTDNSGVLSVSPTDVTIDPATDSIVYFDAGDSTVHRDLIIHQMALQAGDGLTSGTGTYAVGAGDGIDVAADAVAVDVTDIIDTSYGLKEATNNIQMNIAATKGLTFDTGALQLDLDELADVAVDVSADSLAFVDEGTGGDPTGLTTIPLLVTAVAGAVATTGLVATSGVLSVVPCSLTTKTPIAADIICLGDSAAPTLAKGATITQVAEVLAGTVTATGIENTAGVLSVVPCSLTAKNTPLAADIICIGDSAAPTLAKGSTITEVAETMAGTVTTTGIENTAGVLSVVPCSLTAKSTPLVADVFCMGDSAAPTLAKKTTVTELMEVVAGTVTTTGIENTTGVLSVVPMSLTAKTTPVGADGILIGDSAAPTLAKVSTLTEVAAVMAGTGLGASTGVLSTMTPGAMAVGTILFGGIADCTSVTIGETTYTRGSIDTPAGIWPEGGSADAGATNLAVAINGKTASPYAATANTDTVHVYAKTVGTALNDTISKTGGSHPGTFENTVGGLDAAAKKWCMRRHVVTASDVDTATLVNIPIPFVPTMFTVYVTTAAGVPRTTLTDTYTIQTAPNRIAIAGASGAGSLIATDIVTVTAHE